MSRLVGRMRIAIQPRRSSPGTDPSADVVITIASDTRPVRLEGIVVRQARPGWVTLDVPPLEAWEDRLRWVTPEQRERIESAEFYCLLQEHVSRRFLALKRDGP